MYFATSCQVVTKDTTNKNEKKFNHFFWTSEALVLNTAYQSTAEMKFRLYRFFLYLASPL